MKCKVLFVFIVLCLGACGSEDGAPLASEIQPADSIPLEDISLSTSVSFMHISDTHGSSVSVIPMVEALNSTDCDFGIISGDILPDDYMMSWINRSVKPIFLIPGNHDAYDENGEGQFGFRKNVNNNNKTIPNVVYGDAAGNYYYYDFNRDTLDFRVIALDQFEVDVMGKGTHYDVAMTQKQYDWFIQVLENSYSLDGFIVVIHDGFGNQQIGQRNIDNTNKFISTLARDFYNAYDFNGGANPLIIPDIIEAYMTGVNITKEAYASGYEAFPIEITTHFKGPHRNFIAYFGGHLHWDEVEYLNSHPNQLLVLIAYGGVGTMSNYNDLIKTATGVSSYNINYNVVDFEKKKFTIHRLGAKETISGVVRDSIAFDILK